MSQANQLAIAGSTSLVVDPSGVGSRTQQNIPRFLLKLYEIVNNPANESLVKWSDAGDSFYIHNQERFAREVLGKWFKHQNFSSFVRQLNLYGFRKISALQQGLLRGDNEAETVQFTHPYFHRGQPDLLALIQRRRNATAHVQGDESAVGLLQASLSNDGKAANQAVDVHSIVEGINAIRRQQQAIASDLSALKQSNDALWKEAIEARERHAKHEDTINRILKFLAGLFGKVVQGHSRDQLHSDDKTTPARRLLIDDGRANRREDTDYMESDLDTRSNPGSRAHSPFSISSDRFAAIETPETSVASPALTVNEVSHFGPQASSMPLQTSLDVSSQKPVTGPTTSASIPSSKLSVTTAPSDSTATPAVPSMSTQNTSNPDAMWLAILQHLQNSPAELHRFLQAFANQQPNNLLPNTTLPPPALFPPMDPPQQQSSDVQYPIQQFPTPQPANQASALAFAPLQPLAAESQDPGLLDHAERLNKTYRDTSEIDADVDNVQSNIHALMRSMGLDPNDTTFPTVSQPAEPSPPFPVHEPDQDLPEFSFDSWLNQLSGVGGPDLAYPSSFGPSGAGHNDLTGKDFSEFLDIPALDGSLSAPIPTASGDAALSSPTGLKRKTGMADIPDSVADDAPSTKRKR